MQDRQDIVTRPHTDTHYAGNYLNSNHANILA